MKTVLAASLRPALWSVVLTGGLSPLVLAQALLTDSPIQHMPSDVAVTPDGTVAIVRASEAGPATSQPNGLTAWNMSTGQQLPLQGTPPAGFGLGENQGFLLTPGPTGTPTSVHFSDLVQTTNNRAIAIGSQRSAIGTVDDSTFVNFLRIDAPTSETVPPTPPTVSHMAAFNITGSLPTNMAGHAHDIAITPNGAIAVVSHRNWVHFFTMNAGGLLGSDNIGNHLVPFNNVDYRPCSPELAVDSVAVTNTRAVVITTKRDPVSPQNPQAIMVAYVYDLTANPVVRLAAIHIGNDSALNAQPVVAHDLAITPDGTSAIVTGNFVTGRIALDATPPQLKGIRIDTGETRTYTKNADSVEVTLDHAVVTSSYVSLFSSLAHWRIAVFELVDFSIVGTIHTDASANPEKEAHDLTITPNGKYAVVRGGTDIIIVHMKELLPPIVISNLGGDPTNAYLAYNSRSVISDSIIATNSLAVSIGTNNNAPNSDGVVDFVDLSGATPLLVHEAIISHAAPLNPVVAADLAFTPGGNRVVVRCTDTTGPGNALRFYSCLAPIGQLVIPNGSFSSSGRAFSADSLEMGTDSLISISELRFGFPAWNNGTGRVQVLRLQ